MKSYKSRSHKVVLCHGACLWNLNVASPGQVQFHDAQPCFVLAFCFLRCLFLQFSCTLGPSKTTNQPFPIQYVPGHSSYHPLSGVRAAWSLKWSGLERTERWLTYLQATFFYQNRRALRLFLCLVQFLTWSGRHMKVHAVSVNHG